MARKDVLAAGGHKATFAGGFDTGETDILRNVSPEGKEEIIVSPSAPAPRKKFIPLGETVLIRRNEAKTPSGILLADTAQKDAPVEGRVLAIGADVKTIRLGQEVTFGKYAGAEYELNGEKLLLMQIDDILGILELESVGDDYVVPAGRA